MHPSPRFRFFWLLAISIATLLTSLSVGATPFAWSRVVATFIGLGTPIEHLILIDLRAPRVFLGFLVGAALALAGWLFQWLSRNDLSSPEALGVLDGAALGAVGFLYVFSNEANALVIPVHWQPLAALIGALCAGLLLHSLVVQYNDRSFRLIIIGSIIAVTLKGIINLLLIAGPVYTASSALLWLSGSLHHATWPAVMWVGTALTLTIPVVLFFRLALLQSLLDETSAKSTGLNVVQTQRFILLLAIMLTATAVAFTGAMGFIGLIAPHIAIRLFKFNLRWLVFAVILMGGTLTCLADLFARVAFAPIELPTGAVTALIGAPYFLFLLFKRGAISNA